MHPKTAAIALGRPQEAGAPMNAPIEMATAYRAGGPVMYSRDHNRTWAPIEEVIAALELLEVVAHGAAFGSGISALTAITDVVMHRTGPVPVLVAPVVPFAGTTGRRSREFESARVPAGLIRLSAGCEEVEDLWADLAAALGRA